MKKFLDWIKDRVGVWWPEHGEPAAGTAAALLIICLSLSGCVLGLSGSDYGKMTPEQIKAMQDLAMDVYTCTTISGPPPTGRTVFIMTPRLDKNADVRFGEGCLIK